MIAQPQYPQKMPPEEYLEWEETQEFRHEYIDGEIYAMTGSSLPHNDIALNLYTALRPHLRQRGCRVNVSDVKVQTNQNSRYFYPDLVVSCHTDDLQSRRFIQHPTVIIEILSPSTSNYDHTKKLKYYRQISSLQEYILVDSEEIGVEVYRRGNSKVWTYYAYTEGEEVEIPSIEFRCSIDLIYDGVIFDRENP
jgi:Uma2 family endonuclease